MAIEKFLDHLNRLEAETMSLLEEPRSVSSRTVAIPSSVLPDFLSADSLQLEFNSDDLFHRAEDCLLKLNDFFYASFLFQYRAWTGHEAWYLSHYGQSGQIFALNSHPKKIKMASAPVPKTIQIGNARAFTEWLGLATIAPEIDAHLFRISPHPSLVFAFISNRPSLWIEDEMNAVSNFLINTLEKK